MNQQTENDVAVEATHTADDNQPLSEHVETYAGHISSRHGKVNGWLAVVYLILFIWAIYYGFTHWGGLGPGLDY